jgi:hypothetical protein
MAGYVIFCILPHSRYVEVKDGKLQVYESDPNSSFDTKILVVHESGTNDMMDLCAIGELFGFEYSPFMQFLHERVLRNVQFWGLDERANIPDSEEYGHATNIEAGYVINTVSIRYIGDVDGIDVGYGIFAEKIIEVGTMIGEYTGVVMENSISISSSYSLNYPCADGGLVVNASEIGNMIRFVNHSANPNTEFKPFLHLGMVHVVCVSKVMTL